MEKRLLIMTFLSFFSLISSCKVTKLKEKEQNYINSGEYNSKTNYHPNISILLDIFTPPIIDYSSLPKTKLVGNRIFNYVESLYTFNHINPIFEYEDKSKRWYIVESPIGIFTYRYHDNLKGLEGKAFKIDFYDENVFIKTIDLKSTNPYLTSKFNALINEGIEINLAEEIPISDTNIQYNKRITDYGFKAFTYTDVWESEKNYVVINHAYIAIDSLKRYIGEEHTLIIMDNKGSEIAKVENLPNGISYPTPVYRGKYLSYISNNYIENNNKLIILDLANNSKIFDSDIINKKLQYTAINTLDINEHNQQPYLSNDSCYILASVNPSKIDALNKCEVIPLYIDIQNKMVYFGCFEGAEWTKFTFPKGHYEIISKLRYKGINF
jgi:hypothetical protein